MRGARVSAEGASVSASGLFFVAVVPPRDSWRVTALIQPIIDGQTLASRFPLDQPVESADPAQRQDAWERGSPVAETTHPGLGRAGPRSRADLGSLRIFDTEQPRPAAGGGGRRALVHDHLRSRFLLTSWMALPLDQSLAVGTVRTLAALQGEHVDALSEEEPGKIIHELRHGASVSGDPGDSRGAAYYGSVDATPLFVVLLGELLRWGVLPPDDAGEFLVHADRALEWIERYGDLDGDGFVEYQRRSPTGAGQPGLEGFPRLRAASPTGRSLEGPIALVEVQGYVYEAKLRADVYLSAISEIQTGGRRSFVRQADRA